MGVDYTLIRTSDYLDAVLSKFLFQRMSTRANPARRLTRRRTPPARAGVAHIAEDVRARWRHLPEQPTPRPAPMFSAFLNPFTLIAGGLLVSMPIIIHLINRIRFRRVKWAAMEFLLKAQKRMRRRKILEQLILLFLRCLLVFLAGLLLARFIGWPSSGKQTRATAHVIVLDDTPSMGDRWVREEGGQTDAFAEGKRLIYEKLAPAVAEAQTVQTVQVIRLSDLELVFPEKMKDGPDGKKVSKSPEELRDEARINGKSIGGAGRTPPGSKRFQRCAHPPLRTR